MVQVGLVEDQYYRNPVSLSRCQVAVDESGGGYRIRDSGDQEGLIDIGCDDMGLLGEILGSPDDVIFPFMDFINQPQGNRTIQAIPGEVFKSNPVAHSDRACCFQTFDPQIAFDFAFKDFTGFRLDCKPAPGCFYDNSFFQESGLLFPVENNFPTVAGFHDVKGLLIPFCRKTVCDHFGNIQSGQQHHFHLVPGFIHLSAINAL